MSFFKESYDVFQSVQVGMTEEEVVARLGHPQKVFTAESAPADYYVKDTPTRIGESRTRFSFV
jgi:hypothetical protein